MATKTVTLNGVARRITGLSEDDPYYAGIDDRFEGGFAAFCARYLREDDSCWDIGANIGVTALLMSQACPRGRVVCVEANRPVFELLRQNLTENGAGNVTPLHFAIGDRDGPAFFNEQSAYGHLAAAGTAVTMVTPETLLAKAEGRLPNFIKIDVEGYEPFVLKSAVDLIRRSGAIVHLEFNSWCLLHHTRQHPLEFLEWLVDTFGEARIVREGAVLERFGREGVPTILHDNLMRYGCVNDLVVTFAPDRLA